ncbi:MAG TPA: DUF58 domain-containing protein [Vicinamibacterales bacterium]|nr:DUF58 domain-containing protein [Vicinamibacterales bacterium]
MVKVRTAEQRFLDPAVLARISSLELRARTIVEGFLSGLHRGPLKGFSVEFAEYRPYLPGDDLSTIDWKVFARTDRHFVKQYEEETSLRAYLILDVSASMSYGTGPLTKLEYGACLAASLAYLLKRQRDSAGLTTFDDRIRTLLPPGSRPGHFRAMLNALGSQTPGGSTDAGRLLHRLAEVVTKRGLVVLISDLLDDPDRVIDGLKHLRFRGNDVLVFQVLDRAELTFPFEGSATFRDVESDERVVTEPAAARKEYLAALEAHLERYRRDLRLAGIDYQLLDTSEPLDMALHSFLSVRTRRQ